MQTQAGKSLHPLLWVAGVVFILFCGAGVAAMMGWIGSSASKTAEPSPVTQLDRQPRAAAERPHAARAAVAAVCHECGVVQSVQEVDSNGAGGSGVGYAGGAVVGGVLGHQVGEGNGKKVATVVGAVGGALLGNEAEKRVNTLKTFDITVRFDDGSSRVLNEANATSWRVGDKVKVVNGVLHANS
ncbi:MAG TPA: glycine zipper 2TM domain-containing protein [Steroidobacteraceae bacterium]|nr:glycine zipper 2TM domain-containing protein [Steroidobacteraceae bacterium]